MSSYRLVVCIDIEADSLTEAYRKIHQTMTDTGLEWESSDEAYDTEGEEISPEELSAARMSVLASLEENRCPHGMFFTGVGACPACGG